MSLFNHILSFDDNSVLVVEIRILLDDIIKTFLAKGWFSYYSRFKIYNNSFNCRRCPWKIITRKEVLEILNGLN